MAWDGKGVDPWLPQRLAHETRIVATERRLFNGWWASFSEWLVRVQRTVLASPAPDPHAVWAFAPLWTAKMAAFVAGPVKDAVGMAYDSLFGKGYHFDSRPAVTRHLAEVTNRMVRTPEEVFNVVAGAVAKGAGQGESIPSIAARVEDVLTTTGSENWMGRATVVARTETLAALNAGRDDAFHAVAEVLGGDMEHQWLATLDNRVRPAHLAADLQRVPLGTPFLVGGEHLMRPGDPNGSADNVIQCRCSTLLVRPGENTDMTGRGFSDADDWWASQIDEAK